MTFFLSERSSLNTPPTLFFFEKERKEFTICGHVGLAGALTLADEKTMKRLLLFDWLRGPDSTGLAASRHGKTDVEVVKIASHPLDLFETKRFTTVLNAYSSDVFLGHNRAATRGKVNGLNAHPFECGHIVGAHNGTLDTQSWKELDTLLGEETEVDSKAIFLAIERFGLEETCKRMYGAWALVWIDTKKNTLNFLRNKQRPLWYAMTKDETKLMWASEYPMLECATSLSDETYKLRLDKEGYAYFPFQINTHYSWDLESLRSEKGSSEPTLTTMKEQEAPVKPATNFTRPGWYTNPPGTTTTSTTVTTGTVGTTPGTTKENKRKQVIVYGSKDDPFGGIIGPDKFDELAATGCSYCAGPVSMTDTGITIHYDDDIILCADCGAEASRSTKIYLSVSDFDLVSSILNN